MKKFKYIILAAALVAVLCLAGCGQTVEVRIKERNVTTTIQVPIGRTVSAALRDAGISLCENDRVTPAGNEKIRESMDIFVERSAIVTLFVDGEPLEVIVLGGHVADVLDAAGITLGANDLLDKDLDALIRSGEKIVLLTNQPTEIRERAEIPFERRTVETSSLDKGTEKVTQEGEKGIKETVYKITYKNGKEESRKIISEEVIKEPVDEITSVGTYVPGQSADSGGADSGRTIVSKVAFPNCDDGSHGYYEITYSDGSVEYVVY